MGLSVVISETWYKPSRRLGHRIIFPAAGQEKEHNFAPVHYRALMGPCANPKIFRQNCPSALLIKSADPRFIGRAILKPITEGNDRVFVENCLKRSSEFWTKIMV